MAEQPNPVGYEALSDYLAGRSEQELSLSFADIEGILGRSLSHSAYIAAWWRNTSNTAQGRAWLSVGWRVQYRYVRLRMVTFARQTGAEG